MKPIHWSARALASALLFAPAALAQTPVPAPAPAPAAEQKPPRVVPGELEAEYKQLEKEFGEAKRKFQEALLARRAELERAGQDAGAADRTGDPGPEFVPRYRAYASRAKGTVWGGLALLKTIELARDKVDLGWLVELVDVYANDAMVGERAAMRINGLSWVLGSETTEGTLRRLMARSTVANVQAAATFALGTALMTAEVVPGRETGANSAEREAEAKKLLALVVEKHAQTTYGERAKGALFELEHLVIGKTAPDFETVDENGKAWKLSDYRGKVTIIDFWGYW